MNGSISKILFAIAYSKRTRIVPVEKSHFSHITFRFPQFAYDFDVSIARCFAADIQLGLNHDLYLVNSEYSVNIIMIDFNRLL